MKITNECNMKLMARYEDNHFDLAIVDPPYGIDINSSGTHFKEKYEVKDWDKNTPSKEYFEELKRVSKNQIIWGGNYFLDKLGNCKCAKEGNKILDTHLGSGSIAIACHNLGYDLTACELDKEYYEAAMKRINTHKSQLRLC